MKGLVFQVLFSLKKRQILWLFNEIMRTIKERKGGGNMKGVILVNAYKIYDSVAHQIRRLQEEFLKKQIMVDVWNNEHPPVYIQNANIHNELSEYDFVINLDKDQYIVQLLEKAGMKVFNCAKSLVLCDDKMLTYISLTRENIAMPKTIAAPLCYHNYANENWLHFLTSELSFPMVAKECFGSLGAQVYLIHNWEELCEKEEQLRMKPHLYQEYIASSYGRDVRVIVIGGKAFAWMERQSTGDFRSNLAQGGSMKEISLAPSFQEMAEKVARVLELDYCGIDLLYGKQDEPILCEVNSNAFFLGIEKLTGKNVAGEWVEQILKKIKN